ncbi:MAG: hypothetical protein JNK02_17505 [Planctomycetes bacterium]|nr:hypothetical protein [Planctomycetota bacterium]
MHTLATLFLAALPWPAAFAPAAAPFQAQAADPEGTPAWVGLGEKHGAPPAEPAPRFEDPLPVPSAKDRGGDPLAGLVLFEDAESAVLAVSARWKGRFEAEGATFVPYFGPRAPRNAPLVLRTSAIQAGATSVAIEHESLERAGDRVRIERGAVDELWRLAPEGAEQMFVIDAPVAPGELVVRVAFEGPYAAELGPDGVTFTGELGRLRYGRAFAFDAAGRTTDVAQRLADGAIELVVPAAFLAAAAYPVTIDPLLYVFGVDVTDFETHQADVAYEHGSGRWAYVFTRVWSATDDDLLVQFATDSGLIPDSLRVIDGSLTSWSRPSIASNRQVANFLVVAEVGPPGARSIHGRYVDAFTMQVGGSIAIATGVFGDRWHPTVGGDPEGIPPTAYCVAWQRELSSTDQDIQARLVAPLVGGTSHPVFGIETSSATRDRFPRISKSNGHAPFISQAWTVVWERDVSPTDGDILAAQIRWDGTITTPSFVVAGGASDDRRPAAAMIEDEAGGPRHTLLTWTRGMPDADRNVVAAAIVGSSVSGVLDVSAGSPLPQYDDAEPRIDGDGRFHAVVWTKRGPWAEPDSWLAWLAVSGGELQRAAGTEVSGGSVLAERTPSVASKRGGGAWSRRFAVAFERVEGGTCNVQAAVHEAPFSLPPVPYCAGLSVSCPCGNGGIGGAGCANSVDPGGALLAGTGHARVAADSLALTVSGLPTTASCLFFQGSAQTSQVFGDGLRCAGGIVVRIGAKAASAGVAVYPSAADPLLSIQGGVPAGGATRHYQVWYRNAAPYCTPSTFNLSNALRVVWLP